MNSEKVTEKPENDGEDLEDLAEKELLAAAKVIEQVRIEFEFIYLFRLRMNFWLLNKDKYKLSQLYLLMFLT